MIRARIWIGLLLAIPSSLAAQQGDSARAHARELILEHRFDADASGEVVVNLARRIVYWVELTGQGTPVFAQAQRRFRDPFLALIAEGAGDIPRRFELHSRHTGPHRVTLSGIPSGSTAILRIFRDVLETERISEKRDRSLAVGLVLAGGVHSGYRLDPTGGLDPAGGGDVEGCFLAEAGERWGTCLGVGRQRFPDAGFTATWLFIEQRGRILSRRSFSSRRLDLGASLRYSYAPTAGPRRLHPALLGFGLQVTQHLAAEGRRRGWSLFVAFQHLRLGQAPETERLDADRLMAGLIWVP